MIIFNIILIKVSMNNYMDSARVAYRSIPFISRALQTNDEGKYLPIIDEEIQTCRGFVFIALNCANFQFIFNISDLVFPYVISANSSFGFTAVVAFSTPFVIGVGLVALGILGYKLDEMLTHRAATQAAINEFTNEAILSVSNSAVDWLLGDVSRIKQLLKSKNVNLDKKDYNNFNLLARAVRRDDIEIFSLLWDRASDKNKAKVLEVLIDCSSLRISQSDVHQKTLDFLIDNHKICPKEFTQKEHHRVLHYALDYRIWLKKMVDLGFSIDARGETGKSIREELSDDILNFAFDHADNFNMYDGREKYYLEKIKVLQSTAEPRVSAVLAEEHKNENSFLSKLPIELFEEISKDVKDSFAPRNEYQISQLEAIAPFLEFSYDSIRKAATEDNVRIGNIIWDRIGKNDRVNLFIDCFFCHKNSKLGLSLIEGKKVSGTMFTEPEQLEIFKNMFVNWKEIGVYPEFLNKLIDLGFNMNSRNGYGKTIRETLETALNDQYIDKEQKIYYTKALELIDKAFKRQIINYGLILKPGLSEETSNLKVFPTDILTHIMQTLSQTY